MDFSWTKNNLRSIKKKRGIKNNAHIKEGKEKYKQKITAELTDKFIISKDTEEILSQFYEITGEDRVEKIKKLLPSVYLLY